MLRIDSESRSELYLIDEESGTQFYICKTRSAWEHTFESYNTLCNYERQHKTDFALGSDSDVMIHLYYKPEYKGGMYRCIDGIRGTDDNGKEIHPVRIGLVENGLISDACGDMLFGNIWKITKSDDGIYYVREVSENYDDETDVFVDGKLIEA